MSTERAAGKVRVCLWATTFQADIYTLARRLAQTPGFEPVVVLEDAEGWKREPIAKLLPLSCPLLDMHAVDTLPKLRKFAPQVTVVDNHFPPERLSPALFIIWHGQGWKGPQDRREFADIHTKIKWFTGKSAERPNPLFRWMTAGTTEVEHRHHVTGFARENIVAAGFPLVDDMVDGLVSREAALAFYPPAFADKHICLFAPTWHFNRIFPHLDNDIELFARLFEQLRRQNCAIILRMHDRKRFTPEFLVELDKLVADSPDILIKFKDQSRDNLLDMVVSDFLISNYSGLMMYYYATGCPAIHLYPTRPEQDVFMYRVWKRGKVREIKAPDQGYIWRLPPEENGGIVVRSLEELETALTRSLAEPGFCRDAAQNYISRHMIPYDGQASARVMKTLRDLAMASESEIKRGPLSRLWRAMLSPLRLP